MACRLRMSGLIQLSSRGVVDTERSFIILDRVESDIVDWEEEESEMSRCMGTPPRGSLAILGRGLDGVLGLGVRSLLAGDGGGVDSAGRFFMGIVEFRCIDKI
jgi:hypothetical protein